MISTTNALDFGMKRHYSSKSQIFENKLKVKSFGSVIAKVKNYFEKHIYLFWFFCFIGLPLAVLVIVASITLMVATILSFVL